MNKGDGGRFKKKLPIGSLYAAICNVALFKNMKEKQFKDQIFISYSEEGVIIEANNQQQWKRSCKYVQNFIASKRIALLTYGFQKQQYQQLIVKGLKDFTRKIKQKGQQCPYINIIHYQKLRKSCEYMDKQHYLQPLKDWERKNKKNPQFAFLIVQPIHKFEQVKHHLLEHLLKKQIKITTYQVSPLYFLLLFYSSNIKDQLKQNYQKTYLQLSIQKNSSINQEYLVKITNYTNIKIDNYLYQVVSNSKNLSRLGLQYVSYLQIQQQSKKAKQFFSSTTTNYKNQTIFVSTIFQEIHKSLKEKHGQEYCIIFYKKTQKQKYQAIINKFVKPSRKKTGIQLNDLIIKQKICQYDQIQFFETLKQTINYNTHRVCINNSPFLVYQYSNIPLHQIQTFLLYIEQLKTYYCTYTVRFYGISIKQSQSIQKRSFQQQIQLYKYFLIFDYHHQTIQFMLQNDMILDNYQIGQISLQILYLVNFLHTHQQPRALGSMYLNQLYWPLKVILPYLKKQINEKIDKNYITGGQGFEGDVAMVGNFMKRLNQWQQDDQEDQTDPFKMIMKQMTHKQKSERINLNKSIIKLQQLLHTS